MSEFIWRFYVLHSEDHSVLRSYFYIFLKSDIDASHIWDIPLLIKESKKQRMPLKTSCSPNLCNFKHFWQQLWSTCSSYIYDTDFFLHLDLLLGWCLHFQGGAESPIVCFNVGGKKFYVVGSLYSTKFWSDLMSLIMNHIVLIRFVIRAGVWVQS